MTHVGDLRVRALRQLWRWAEVVVDAGTQGGAPNTLVGGVGVSAQAAVLPAHRAVVERHCRRRRRRRVWGRDEEDGAEVR